MYPLYTTAENKYFEENNNYSIPAETSHMIRLRVYDSAALTVI